MRAIDLVHDHFMLDRILDTDGQRGLLYSGIFERETLSCSEIVWRGVGMGSPTAAGAGSRTNDPISIFALSLSPILALPLFPFLGNLPASQFFSQFVRLPLPSLLEDFLPPFHIPTIHPWDPAQYVTEKGKGAKRLSPTKKYSDRQDI